MSCKNLVLFIFSFFILFSSLSIKAQEVDSLYYTNPDYHVAKELFNHRIVMLGDYDHNQPGVYLHVYNVLENWLGNCRTRDSTFKLTLITEDGVQSAKAIDSFFITGDVRTLIDRVNPNFYLENLEYYTRLRHFSMMIDSVNNFRKNKISFEIKGFEEGFEEGFEKVAHLSQRDKLLWFVNERDSNTSAGIIKYMNQNPDNQILVFYGNAHLQSGYLNKSFGSPELTEQESMGYYLAHYLKKEFGDSNVISFFTTYNLYDIVRNPDLKVLNDNDFITRPENLKNTEWPYNNVDYIFICNSYPVPNFPGLSVKSDYVLEETIKFLNKWRPDFISIKNSNFAENILLMTGKKFDDDSTLNYWLSKKKYDCTGWLYSKEFDNVFFESLMNSRNIRNFFRDYGIKWKGDTSKAHFKKMKEMIFPDLMKKIKFLNSIGIYWFGYPNEKIKAKEYLVKFSGEDYAEPEKYLQWYRMKYYGYKY